MIRHLGLSLLSILMWSTANAGVTIDGTRIIFPSNAKSVSVQLRNNFNAPALVQTWIDDGNQMEIPDGEKIPFILNPSLTRIEARKGQIIRIIPTRTETLPQDRESIYWFNLLDIPPENPEFLDKNKVKFNVRTRIKLFYRPTSLRMHPQRAYESLQFGFSPQKQLIVNNPTPYFVTITRIQKLSEEKNYLDGAVMLIPYQKIEIKLNQQLTGKTPFTYTVINDIGTPITLSPQHIL